jgi:hypothetical protein
LQIENKIQEKAEDTLELSDILPIDKDGINKVD